ncbi:MAG: hypothetical protein IKY45_04390 [Clostridia bacterium]|nr:hypothetical protein [Clostridia bacterium]
MRFEKILFFFYAALPVSIILRLVQINFIIDDKTGFFKHEFMTFGVAVLVVIFAVAIIFSVFAFLSHRSPEQPPKSNIFLSFTSFLAAFSLFLENFVMIPNYTVSNFQLIFLNITALMAILFFLIFGFKYFFDYSFPNLCFVFPCVYFIMKIIFEFVVVSALAVISENTLFITALCSLMTFFLQFAKLYNKTDKEYNFRKLLASGSVSVLFCFVQSIPFFIHGFMNGFENTHTNVFTNITLFVMGCFVLTFLSLHYSQKNAYSNNQ